MDRQLATESFGGKCQRCGYSKCQRALQFHHTNGREGKGGRVDIREVEEFPERFEMLCANCHIEEHDRRDRERIVYQTCEHCGKEFRSKRVHIESGRKKFCSKACTYASMIRAPGETTEKRFWKYVTKDGECLIWTGHTVDGVPMLGFKGEDGVHRVTSARRIAFEVIRGRKPNSKRIFVSCANHLCVNPDHFATKSGSPVD